MSLLNYLCYGMINSQSSKCFTPPMLTANICSDGVLWEGKPLVWFMHKCLLHNIWHSLTCCGIWELPPLESIMSEMMSQIGKLSVLNLQSFIHWSLHLMLMLSSDQCTCVNSSRASPEGSSCTPASGYWHKLELSEAVLRENIALYCFPKGKHCTFFHHMDPASTIDFRIPTVICVYCWGMQGTGWLEKNWCAISPQLRSD